MQPEFLKVCVTPIWVSNLPQLQNGVDTFCWVQDDIRREAMTMSLINHPNVVKAYCSFVVNQSLWVVMPYMAGGSCLHIMKAAYPDGFEEPVIATVLKESLKALEYLHRHGHIHRDVKVFPGLSFP